MELRIGNREIGASAYDILVKLKKDARDGLFYQIIDRGDNVFVCCPFHKGGREQHPSCGVLAKRDDPNRQFGLVHCFTCGYSATLPKFVSDVLNVDGDTWLLKNFGNVFLEEFKPLEPIDLTEKKKEYLQESILDQYDYYHPYMWKRGLSKEVVDKFRIGYDKETNSITFPMWNEYGALVGISKRCVDTKRFDNQHGVEKPVYLLNYIKQCGITNVYVAESQINALTLWTWGYPAIAMCGTGSDTQYEILKRSGIRVYNLCFDGDDAGRKATAKFIKKLGDGVFINVVKIPDGKDVNDLTKEEFDKLEVI